MTFVPAVTKEEINSINTGTNKNKIRKNLLIIYIYIYSLLYILTCLEEQIEIEDDWVEQSEKEKERDIFLGWLC